MGGATAFKRPEACQRNKVEEVDAFEQSAGMLV
jgi:hypothetical protein